MTSHTGDEAKLACIEALLAHTTDNIYFKDGDSRFLLVSEHMAHWCGKLSAAEMAGLTDADLFAPAHAGEARADEQALLRAETPFIRKEERETWPDGRVTWVSTIKLPLQNREGAIIGTFGISRDITQQKNAEDAQQTLLERLREMEGVIHHSRAVAFRRDAAPGWPIRYVSDNIAQFGYQAREFLARQVRFAQLMHPDDVAAVEAAMARFEAAGQSDYAVDYRLRTRAGAVRWVEERGLILRDAGGRVTHYQGLVMDVTERHEAEAQIAAYRERLEQMVAVRTRDLEATNRRLEAEIAQRVASEAALKDSEQRHRRLLESVTDYVYRVEVRAGRPVATQHGPGCEAVTGYRPEDFERLPFLWIDMVHPEDRATVLRQSARLLEGLDAPPVEHRIRRKDGAIRWVRNTPVARRGPDGARAGYEGLVKDITERRETEEARLQAERVLHQARERETMERADRLASLGLLAAGVAHEVNNPLQGMLSHLETVRRTLPPDFPRLTSLDMVGRGIRTIAELVQRLLWLGATRTDEGEVSDFADAVAFVRDLLANQFAKAGVQLDIRARDLHLKLAIPHREIVQVLLNLLMNARDAMPGGGAVTITCNREGPEAAIAIADTGVGIPPAVIGQIFTPFFTTKGARGVGLGLSMAESILRGRRGTIAVASTPGAGATFTVRLPISEDRR